MTYITETTAIAHTTTIFAKILRSLRKLLEVATSAESPEQAQASGLSQRLNYDVGLSDYCPDRTISRRPGASGDISREIMRRGF